MGWTYLPPGLHYRLLFYHKERTNKNKQKYVNNNAIFLFSFSFILWGQYGGQPTPRANGGECEYLQIKLNYKV